MRRSEGVKPKVLVTREVFDETLTYLSEHCDVEANQEDIAMSTDELVQRASDKRGVVCSLTDRIDERVIAACSKLEVVANIAVGYNNIDVAACTARGVMVTNTPGVLDDSTADLAWTLMLGAARRVTEVERRVRNGEWTGWRLKQWLGTDVHHATLGIVGMGRIGRAVAQRARGFDMPILYHNRTRLPADLEKGATYYASLDEMLPHCRVLSLNLPGSGVTLMTREKLALLPRGAVFVNSARGSLVDEGALLELLASGQIAAAGLDVFRNEPKFDQRFKDLPNAFLLPHIGTATIETRVAMAMRALDNIAAVLSGKPAPDEVRI
jgi:gluconate 2-dehydrogenase